MTPESRLAAQIKLWCGEHNWLCHHINVGKFYTPQGTLISIGPGEGFPDLQILTDNGIAMFIETKIHPNKPTAKQLEWQQLLRDRGFISGTVYSLDDFLSLLYSERSDLVTK